MNCSGPLSRYSMLVLRRGGGGSAIPGSSATHRLAIIQQSSKMILSSEATLINNSLSFPSSQRRWKSDDSSSPPEIIYTSPMGDLISRLKIVSITSCLMSVVGLPLFIFIKNGDFPTMQQMGLGGVAFMGATGSTIALHFVFGPYILELERIPVRQCHYEKESSDDDEKAPTKQEITDDSTNMGSSTMLRATTRSVFGFKSEVIFDPDIDITPYTGARPFANFVAKGVTLYAHPELLEDKVRQQLLYSSHPLIVEEPKKSNPDDDFL
jgi:hypothetical protein